MPVLSLAGCRGEQGQTADRGVGAGSQVITADGSSRVFLITEGVAEEFQKATAGTRVTVGRPGSDTQSKIWNGSAVKETTRHSARTGHTSARAGGVL